MAAGSFDLALPWQAVSVLMLAWLAVFFGKTLRPGRTPLIEQIARVDDPQMPEPLCRYTRWLTAIWCGYFVAAAGCVAWAGMASSLSAPSFAPYAGALVWPGSVALFVGERWLRPWIFPGRKFPGLVRQLQATRHVWSSAGKAGNK
jgi:uncharacterized membrane protein